MRADLAEQGLSSRSIDRLVCELEDHYEDLSLAARDRGAGRQESLEIATAELGSLAGIGRAATEIRSLLRFTVRYPVAGIVMRPLAAAGAGVMALESNGVPGELIRWFAGTLFAAVVTASMFLALQLAIILT